MDGELPRRRSREGGVMAFLVIAAVAYLTGAASGAFLLVVIGIRRGDRPERCWLGPPCLPCSAVRHRIGKR